MKTLIVRYAKRLSKKADNARHMALELILELVRGCHIKKERNYPKIANEIRQVGRLAAKQLSDDLGTFLAALNEMLTVVDWQEPAFKLVRDKALSVQDMLHSVCDHPPAHLHGRTS